MLVEGPIENEMTTSPLIGGYDLVKSLQAQSPNPNVPLSAVQIAKRGSSFAVYGTLAFLYMGFAAAVIVGGVIVARGILTECSVTRWQKALPLAGCGVALLIFVFGARTWHSADFALTWKGFGDFLRASDRTGSLTFWVSLTKTATTFGFVASFVLIALSCVILLPEKNRASSFEGHRQRIETLDLVLALGTALFVFALIRDRAFFAFADCLTSKESGSETVSKSAVLHLADGIITVNGIYLSILTAAIYLPCAFILNARTNCLLPARVLALRFSERKDWLEKHGVDRGLKDHILRAATVLVPAVTGGASGLIDAFGNK
jgi:hypothetical protein